MPEHVIHHIISFLPSHERHQLRLLSRKWRLIYSQLQKELKFHQCRLDEEQLWSIFQDFFPSTEYLSLVNCSGIKNLKLINNKLRNVILLQCKNLENIELTAPNLESFVFSGSLGKPCIVKFGQTTHLKILSLFGTYINETTFSDCNTTFPVISELSIDGTHHMLDCLNISSNSLKKISLFKFKKLYHITIDAPELDFIYYTGHPGDSFSNTNLPKVRTTIIELYLDANDKSPKIWFQKHVGMLQAFKPSDALLLEVSSKKSFLVPEDHRRCLVPPIKGPKSVTVEIYKPPTNIADIIDTMLWMHPRATNLCIRMEGVFNRVSLRHGEIEGALEYSCCSSYPAWRHSLVEYALDMDDESWVKELTSYLKENLKKVGRNAIQRI